MLYIHQPGEIYYVNASDQIYRQGMRCTMPSDNWKLLGAVEYKLVYGVSREIWRYTIADIRLRGLVPWLYKNGQQRCFIIDYDHGTTRVWASPTPYHITGS